MGENNRLSWINVQGYMTDEYKKYVVEKAIQHLPHANKELRSFASKLFNEKITVDGFRSFTKVPASIAVGFILQEFDSKPKICSAVVCLWADAHQSILDYYKETAKKNHVGFKNDWTWLDGIKGYLEFETHEILSRFTQSIINDKAFPERDNLLLAELWFSCAYIENDQASNSISKNESKLNTQEKNMATKIDSDNENVTNLSTQVTEQALIDPNDKNRVGSQEATENYSDILKDSSLIQLIEVVDTTLDVQNKKKEQLLKTLNELTSYVASEDLTSFTSERTIFDSLCFDWIKAINQKEKLFEFLESRIDSEYSKRKDFRYFLMDTEYDQQETHIFTDVSIKQDINTIIEYDEKKLNYWNDILNEHTAISKLQEKLLIWRSEDAIESYPLLSDEMYEQLTLSELHEKLGEILELKYNLSHQIYTYRQICLSNTRMNIDTIEELGVDIQNDKFLEFSLDDLTIDTLNNIDDANLIGLEELLNSRAQELIIQQQKGKSPEIAGRYLQEHNNTLLQELLKSLSENKLNVEAFLLHLALNYLRLRPEQELVLDNNLVDCLLTGLFELSNKDRPFELLNQIAPTFLYGWKAKDKLKAAEICLLSITAHFGGKYKLPEGFFWTISEEWPVLSMSNWNRIWQSLLSNSPLQIFSDKAEAEFKSNLDKCRMAANTALEKDGGHYLRLGGITSSHHKSLLNNHLLPLFDGCFSQISHFDETLKSSPIEKMPVLILDLKTFTQKTSEELLNDKSIEEKYLLLAHSEKVKDYETHQKNSCIKNLKDCAEVLLNYAEALDKYWVLMDTRKFGVQKDDLKNELEQLVHLTPIGTAACENIFDIYNIKNYERDDKEANSLSEVQLIYKIISESNFIKRIPRVVEEIVNNAFSWESLFNKLLEDLSNPLEQEEAAIFLFERNASKQSLLISEYLPLDLQKQVQKQINEHEQKINTLEQELIDYGGNLEILSGDLSSYKCNYELGRWGYLSENLKQSIILYKEEFEKKKRNAQEISFSLREKINNLDNEIFKHNDTIPNAAVQIIEEGLNIARSACSDTELIPYVNIYIEEIKYRLMHKEMPINDLKEAVFQLKRKCTKTEISQSNNLTFENVLEALSNNALENIGLSKGDLTQSNINTRSQLIENCIQIKDIKNVESSKLLPSQINTIQSTYQIFAQLMSMKRFHGADDKPMIFVDRQVYEYWELLYPKTAALNNQCIFLTLPGNPPSAKNIQDLVDFIDSGEFLEYFFVFVFSPGCTVKIAERLRSKYIGKGFVLIDEEILLNMVLAEANGNYPLGILRPKMLNALQANVDIFTVNQSTNEKTGIFVGRDKLIDRISSSSDNYALYGGRRIGKSSILNAVSEKLSKRGFTVIFHSLEGEDEFTDDHISDKLSKKIGLNFLHQTEGNFKFALTKYMELYPTKHLAILIDEIDRYIDANHDRHKLIETLRACSDQFGNRFRVIISGFMSLYDCLQGRGPYTPTSDPWVRMLTDIGPVDNLSPSSAEDIVKEGFGYILGWTFSTYDVPQKIVKKTGGHPAFVQHFCSKLLERVRRRGDKIITPQDVDNIFNDPDPFESFIAFVNKTLTLNLQDPIARYLIIWLASDVSDARGFTLDQINEIANISPTKVSAEDIKRNLERLDVTRVVKRRTSNIFDFSVPDYPSILNRLGETEILNSLEEEIKKRYQVSDNEETRSN